jgi:hypothetical protein
MSDQNQAAERCCILVPAHGAVERECDEGLRVLQSRGYEVRRVGGYAAIDAARNEIASAALRDGFEETMWIDSDIGFNADDVDRLRSHRLPICCGIYPKKGRQELACHVMPGETVVQFGASGGLVEILYAGTGFLHVRREVYDAMRQQLSLPACNEHFGPPHYPYFQPMIVEHPISGGAWYLGEDYSFCERARQCGYKIMADTTIRLTHVGRYGYSWEDAGSEIPRFASYRMTLNWRPSRVKGSDEGSG